uniref:Uncharacterized protein n=1 Tax=Arundo donax TaxID=35708 RepID=A0A0A9DQ90_ARUDO
MASCMISRRRYSTSGASAAETSAPRLGMPTLCAMTSMVSLGTILIALLPPQNPQNPSFPLLAFLRQILWQDGIGIERGER